MRKRFPRVLTVLTLLAAAFSISVWAISLARSQEDRQQAADAGNPKRKTLREAARERDIEVVGSESTQYGDLRALATDADAIIIGRLTEVETSFSQDGEGITTYYTVDVLRVLKALTDQTRPTPPAPLITPLRVVRHGGVINVNGHRASVRAEDEPTHGPLSEGKDYIVFLWWSSDTSRYLIAGGLSGIVLVEDEMSIRSLGTRKELKAKGYERRDLESFINQILPNEEVTQK